MTLTEHKTLSIGNCVTTENEMNGFETENSHSSSLIPLQQNTFNTPLFWDNERIHVQLLCILNQHDTCGTLPD